VFSCIVYTCTCVCIVCVCVCVYTRVYSCDCLPSFVCYPSVEELSWCCIVLYEVATLLVGDCWCSGSLSLLHGSLPRMLRCLTPWSLNDKGEVFFCRLLITLAWHVVWKSEQHTCTVVIIVLQSWIQDFFSGGGGGVGVGVESHRWLTCILCTCVHVYTSK
jgi:hypothetical protein